MTNIFERGINTLKNALKNNAENPVTYHRGALSFAVNVTRGNISYGTIAKLGGVPMEIDYREYIVRVEALPAKFIPQQRDVIEDQDGRWEVFNNNTQDAWRFCDPTHQLIRIYTRKIK